MKKFFKVLGILIVIFIIVFFLIPRTEKINAPTISPLASQEPTFSVEISLPPENWQRYENNEFKFSFLYPNNWELTIADKSNTSTIPLGNALLKIVALESNYEFWQSHFEITVLPNNFNLNVSAWNEERLREDDEEYQNCLINEGTACYSLREMIESQELIDFKNEQALKIRSLEFDHLKECLYFSKNNYIYSFCYEAENPNDPNFEIHQETTSRILQSLEFQN
jgi:hypothetical protein